MAVATGTAMLGAAALGAAGSMYAGNKASQAANTSAAAQQNAARFAAQAGAFRPVGITTGFGSSNFTTEVDPRTGIPYVTGAGYTLSPELAALQQNLLGMAPQSLEQAQAAAAQSAQLQQAGQGLFGLGQQYLATSPEEARQKYMEQQQALLAPSRQAEEERLASSVFGRGRAGLNIGDTGQPELAALASSRRQQDLQLAAAAEQAAQQQIGFGAGLFGTGAGLQQTGYGLQTAALSPFQTQLGLASTIENLGRESLDIGAALGGRTAQAGSTAANALLQGGLGAAQTQLQGSLVGPSLMANNLSSFGNQYIQNQQQQELLKQLYNPYTQAGYAPLLSGYSNPYAANAGVDFTGANVYG